MNEQKIKSQEVYKHVGKLSQLYDGMMTNSTFLGRLAIKYFWQLSGDKYGKFIKQAFNGIPNNFDGHLLEIPIGTGILSLPIYKNLPNAKITGVDYSKEMLNAAENHIKSLDLKNIKLEHGDVSNLIYESNYFDIVLSINGFHVFSDKNAAYEETFRILKTNGIFCGCMYIVDQNSLTDLFVKKICERFGYFMPPYESLESLNKRLNKTYRQVKISHVGSFAGFVCIK